MKEPTIKQVFTLVLAAASLIGSKPSLDVKQAKKMAAKILEDEAPSQDENPFPEDN